MGYHLDSAPFNPPAPESKESNMYVGGGLLVTILIVLAIVYLAKRV